MYKLKKEDFLPKEKHHRDRSHFLDIFKILGTIEDEDYFYLPAEALSPIKEAPLTSELYTYFELVWSNEKKEINIDDIIGSHDYRNYELKTWLSNFLYNDISREKFDKYLKDPMAIFDDENNSLKTFEKDGKHYLADGHHRFSCLYLHYHILKSQNKLPQSFNKKLPSIVRVIPNDLEFITRFVNFCVTNSLYEEDEIGIIPIFKVLDSNPNNPIIVHISSNIQITKDSNLDEILKSIRESNERNKMK